MCFFHPYLGNMSIFDEYFAIGVKPPTRKIFGIYCNHFFNRQVLLSEVGSGTMSRPNRYTSWDAPPKTFVNVRIFPSSSDTRC